MLPPEEPLEELVEELWDTELATDEAGATETLDGAGATTTAEDEDGAGATKTEVEVGAAGDVKGQTTT